MAAPAPDQVMDANSSPGRRRSRFVNSCGEPAQSPEGGGVPVCAVARRRWRRDNGGKCAADEIDSVAGATIDARFDAQIYGESRAQSRRLSLTGVCSSFNVPLLAVSAALNSGPAVSPDLQRPILFHAHLPHCQ